MDTYPIFSLGKPWKSLAHVPRIDPHYRFPLDAMDIFISQVEVVTLKPVALLIE